MNVFRPSRRRAIGAITYLLDRPGARLSKVPVIIEPVKLLSFTKFQ